MNDLMDSSLVKTGLVRKLSIESINPSPENDRLYYPIDPEDPEVQKLAESIREHGILVPLVLTNDGWLLSGHRRLVAAKIAGLTHVPCQTADISRTGDRDTFMRLLMECNRQRVKSFDTQLQEAILSTNPNEAYQTLIHAREERAKVDVPMLNLDGGKARSKITSAKEPMLQAILAIIGRLKAYLPLSERQIHYQLLNKPPLRHAKKPDSLYRNDRNNASDMSDLVTRARIEGTIPMEHIKDETRPVVVWNAWNNSGAFIANELDGVFAGYWRDLMQSQPNHIEIVGEKNTIEGSIRRVSAKYCIPYTIGRGYSSLPPRAAIIDRFKRSGKAQLILLLLSDFDPDGVEIAVTFARSLIQDFDLPPKSLVPYRVALTPEQVKQYKLPVGLEAKSTSSNYKKFVARYGMKAYELEALPPDVLESLLQQAIDDVLDVKAFNAELTQEKKDAHQINAVKRSLLAYMQDSDFRINLECSTKGYE